MVRPGDLATPEVSVVVPVYNSRDCVAPLVQELVVVLNACSTSHEIILINDDSPDDSWSEIVRVSHNVPTLRGVCLLRNFGQHNATIAGLREAQGKYVIIMDDDLQHPPAAIPEILQKLRDGFDVCYTTYRNRQHAVWKKLGSWVNDVAARALLGKPRGLYLSSFKGMNRLVVDAITKYDGPFTYIDGLVLDVTRKIDAIPIEHGKRYAGEGNYGLIKSISLWLKMATSFSILPLRLASFLGIFLGIVAGIYAGYVVVEVLLYGAVYPGWASVIVAVLVVGSIQLLGIGLVGEYLGRAYLRLNNKPQFIVRKRTQSIAASAHVIAAEKNETRP